MPPEAFSPFEELLDRIRREGFMRWADVEEEFLRAVEAFDREYSRGGRTSGWYQSKARYFNDVIVDLLKNASRRDITVRTKKRSKLFDKIDIDICFPTDGEPLIAGEVKILGTPAHPGNADRPRRASADLHKRSREVAFTSLDLKAAYTGPASIASFQAWVDTTSPGYFCFWALRIADDRDLERVRTIVTRLRNYCNGVGAFAYRPKSGTGVTGYEILRLPESVDHALEEMAQRIRSQPAS